MSSKQKCSRSNNSSTSALQNSTDDLDSSKYVQSRSPIKPYRRQYRYGDDIKNTMKGDAETEERQYNRKIREGNMRLDQMGVELYREKRLGKCKRALDFDLSVQPENTNFDEQFQERLDAVDPERNYIFLRHDMSPLRDVDTIDLTPTSDFAYQQKTVTKQNYSNYSSPKTPQNYPIQLSNQDSSYLPSDTSQSYENDTGANTTLPESNQDSSYLPTVTPQTIADDTTANTDPQDQSSKESKEKTPCKNENCDKIDLEKCIIYKIKTKNIEDIKPEDVMKLVENENEDVDTFATITSAYVHFSPGKLDTKKKLQKLRLNSESMALLQQSILYPEPSADEAQLEPTPETMVNIMNNIENQIVPQVDPTAIFNSLFDNTKYDSLMTMSPAANGPVQDVVVPLDDPLDVHTETISREMRLVTKKLNRTFKQREDGPKDNIFTNVMDNEKKQAPIGKLKKKEFKLEEEGPWGEEDIEPVVSLIGAEPIDVLDVSDIEKLKGEGQLKPELQKGMEYFIETNQQQYVSRVQMRGTHPPHWFPGFLFALPQYEDIIQVAKSPSEVFVKAWKAVHPHYFETNDIISLY